MLVPDAACILSNRLPAFATVEDQRQMFGMVERNLGDTVNWVDTVSIMNKHKSEKLYYKTDHHWTTQGAFYMFKDTASLFGIKGDVSDDYVSYTVTDDFNGVLASKSGCGMDEKELETLKNKLKEFDRTSLLPMQKHGIGMVNIYRRLRLFYSDQLEFNVTSKKGEGTRIEILVPLDRKMEGEEHVSGILD